jgi:tetratricopeptide (TPR) repeat protein
MERHNGPADALGDAYRRLANAERQQGRFSLAEKHLKQALKHFACTFNLSEISETHNSLGAVYILMCRLDEAGAILKRPGKAGPRTITTAAWL